MNVEKNGTVYTITDQGTFWKIESVSGKLAVCYKLPKSDCATIDDVRAFIHENDLF